MNDNKQEIIGHVIDLLVRRGHLAQEQIDEFEPYFEVFYDIANLDTLDVDDPDEDEQDELSRYYALCKSFVLCSLPYEQYLQTNHWKAERAKAIERAEGRCQVCNSLHSLHVHHRTYERRGCEQPSDLTVLCATCHKIFHDNGRLVQE